MKGNLFLGGGGGQEDSFLLDQKFINEIKSSNSPIVAYIPVAMESRPYNECLIWFRGIFGDKFSIEMWTELDKITQNDLSRIEAIYIGGGNVGKLLKEIKASGFDSLLKQFVQKGGIVYGGSAGAIILGKNTRTAPEIELRNLTDFSGLNLIRNFSIACHYQDDQSPTIAGLVNNLDSEIIAIPERSGVLLKDGELTVVGYEPIFLFTNQGVTKHFPSQSF